MPKISIVTDTDSSLPESIASRYGILQVPILIHFGEECFETGLNINDKTLFERVDKESKLPTTAAPTPGNFADAFRNAFEKDSSEELVCFCISSAMSATFEAAQIAARDILPDRKISVVDTKTLSVAQGYMAIAAVEAAAKGASVAEIIDIAARIGERSHIYGALATLKYLSMSGRVSHIAAGMAGMLDIKPILSVQNGKLDMLEKVRTKKKAWERVIELAKADAQKSEINKMAVVHVAALDEAREFEALLRANLKCPNEILMAELTPGLSVHTGAGLVAVGFVTEK
ncbi:MAG: DegV family protein [Anaerolineaceae bacterium]|nr:DegV family protein [Anaerolineaceae bacterium]